MSFEEDARARGWPIYPRAQRSLALRSGTLLAWVHGWCIDGVHDLLMAHVAGEPKPAIHIEKPTRLTRASGRLLDVWLDPSVFEDAVEP